MRKVPSQTPGSIDHTATYASNYHLILEGGQKSRAKPAASNCLKFSTLNEICNYPHFQDIQIIFFFALHTFWPSKCNSSGLYDSLYRMNTYYKNRLYLFWIKSLYVYSILSLYLRGSSASVF